LILVEYSSATPSIAISLAGWYIERFKSPRILHVCKALSKQVQKQIWRSDYSRLKMALHRHRFGPEVYVKKAEEDICRTQLRCSLAEPTWDGKLNHLLCPLGKHNKQTCARSCQTFAAKDIPQIIPRHVVLCFYQKHLHSILTGTVATADHPSPVATTPRAPSATGNVRSLERPRAVVGYCGLVLLNEISTQTFDTATETPHSKPPQKAPHDSGTHQSTL
jgi:hypothetical protein